MVRVHENGVTVGHVKYTNNLDRWDGANWSYGKGQHRGIVAYHGVFVVVYGTDFEDAASYGEVVSLAEAKVVLFASGNTELVHHFFLDGIRREELTEDTDILARWGLLN